jgi:predicted aspartyl protease
VKFLGRSRFTIVAGTAFWFGLTNAAPLQATPQQSDSRPDTQFQTLSLARTGQNHLLVIGAINNKPALLVVDTGSPVTVISSRRSKHFGLQSAPARLKWPDTVQVNGESNRLVIARSVRLGGLNLIDAPVVLANMSGARHAARVMHEQEVDGILGADALFATKAVLDCSDQLLFLKLYPERPGQVPGLDLTGFQSMPMVKTEGLNFYIDGAVNGTAARLMVDTGAFATLLHRGFVRQHRIPSRQTDMQSARINLEDDDVEIARIRKLSLGMVDIVGRNVGVTNLSGVLTDEETSKSSPPVVGLLGGEILRRNHAIIDFGSQRLYLRSQAEPVAEAAPKTAGPKTKAFSSTRLVRPGKKQSPSFNSGYSSR